MLNLKDYDFNSEITLMQIFGELRDEEFKNIKGKSSYFEDYNTELKITEEINKKQRSVDIGKGLHRLMMDNGVENSRTTTLLNEMYNKYVPFDTPDIAILKGNETNKSFIYHSFIIDAQTFVDNFDKIHDVENFQIKEFSKLINKSDSFKNYLLERDTDVPLYFVEVLETEYGTFVASTYFLSPITRPQPSFIYDNQFLSRVVPKEIWVDGDSGNTFLYNYYDKSMTNDILHNLIKLQKNTDIDVTRSVDALTKLWSYQILERFNLKTENVFDRMSGDFKELYEEISKYLSDRDIVVGKNRTITFEQLFDYFDEISNGHITENTQSAQEFVNYRDKDSILKSVTLHENYTNISNTIRIIKDDEQVSKEIKRMIYSDKRFNKKISKVSKIFKINDSKKSRKGHKKMTALHGAPNESVLSILLNGLKTPNELRRNKIKYRNTGNALGHGVYFTAHNQVTKSIQYTSNYDKRYIIIADIEYDENNVYDNNNHYGQRIDTSKYSLIRAENISAWSYSEYVVPNSKQINIRYIVELS